jgi:hypothetical protein
MKRITLRRLAAAIPVAAAAILVPAAGSAAAAPFTVAPNPIVLSAPSGETTIKSIKIFNNTGREANIRLTVLPGGEAFDPFDKECAHVAPNAVCVPRIRYTATNQAEDRGTLRVATTTAGGPSIEVPLIGNRSGTGGGSGDTTPPNCTLAARRNQKLIQLVRRHRGRRTLIVKQRNPLNVGVTSSEAGTVSALASGKDSRNKPIFLKVKSAPASAGHGVVLRLRLDAVSEGRVLADIHKNLQPKMTLTANCIDRARNAKQAHAVLHFRDGKVGRAFALPLIADLTAH